MARRRTQEKVAPPELRTAAQQEIIDLLCAENDDFAKIPEVEMWPMSLVAVGTPLEQVARICGRTEAQMAMTFERYGDCIRNIPDVVKLEVTGKLLIQSGPALASVGHDKEKLAKLTPLQAYTALDKMTPVVSALSKVAKELRAQEKQEGGLDYDAFSKRLGG
jgi:hypothetical protein